MPRVGFEPPIPVFKQAKTVHALDRAATAIGTPYIINLKKERKQVELKLYVFIFLDF
jgi:hypothetical protein